MDDATRLSKLDRELGEVWASLKHMPTQDTITSVRKEHQEQAFRTLQEVGGLIGNMRSDVKDWISGLRTENALELKAAEQRIMAAIHAEHSRPWIQKNIGLVVALLGLVFAVLSGNPQWLRLGGF